MIKIITNVHNQIWIFDEIYTSFANSRDVNVSALDSREQYGDATSDGVLRNLMYSLDTRNLTLRTANGSQRSEQVDDEIFASARSSVRGRTSQVVRSNFFAAPYFLFTPTASTRCAAKSICSCHSLAKYGVGISLRCSDDTSRSRDRAKCNLPTIRYNSALPRKLTACIMIKGGLRPLCATVQTCFAMNIQSNLLSYYFTSLDNVLLQSRFFPVVSLYCF